MDGGWGTGSGTVGCSFADIVRSFQFYNQGRARRQRALPATVVCAHATWGGVHVATEFPTYSFLMYG
jgi:hypothetical protein